MLKSFIRNFRRGYYVKYFQNFFLKPIESKNSWNPSEIQWSKFYLENYWLKDARTCKVQWLHNLNQIRIPAIYEAYFTPNDLTDYTRLEPKEEFRSIKILDVGCGGGICSEALASLNFDVTGIDPNPDMIVIAKHHAKDNPLMRNTKLKYYHTTVEDFYTNNINKFDALVISEVLERIPLHKKRAFLHKCISCVRTDGNIFITVRNRTIFSLYMLFVFAVSNRLEFGHHSWANGISPYLMETFLTSLGCTIRSTRGFMYEGYCRGFKLTPDKDGWYFIHAIKNRLLL